MFQSSLKERQERAKAFKEMFKKFRFAFKEINKKFQKHGFLGKTTFVRSYFSTYSNIKKNKFKKIIVGKIYRDIKKYKIEEPQDLTDLSEKDARAFHRLFRRRIKEIIEKDNGRAKFFLKRFLDELEPNAKNKWAKIEKSMLATDLAREVAFNKKNKINPYAKFILKNKIYQESTKFFKNMLEFILNEFQLPPDLVTGRVITWILENTKFDDADKSEAILSYLEFLNDKKRHPEKYPEGDTLEMLRQAIRYIRDSFLQAHPDAYKKFEDVENDDFDFGYAKI